MARRAADRRSPSAGHPGRSCRRRGSGRCVAAWAFSRGVGGSGAHSAHVAARRSADPSGVRPERHHRLALQRPAGLAAASARMVASAGLATGSVVASSPAGLAVLVRLTPSRSRAVAPASPGVPGQVTDGAIERRVGEAQHPP